MAKLFFEDKFLFTEPKDITVVEFSAWRRTGEGKRKFVPFCVLKIGQLDLIIEGYDDMWKFLDCLHPKLPRNALNACMKGDMLFEHGLLFHNELQELITESEAGYIRFDVSVLGRFRFPNSNEVVYDALKMEHCVYNGEHFDIQNPLSQLTKLNGYMGMLAFPIKLKDFDGEYVPTLVFADSENDNRYTLVHATPDYFLVSSSISRGKRGNIRPTRTKKVIFKEDYMNPLVDLVIWARKEVAKYEDNEVDFGLLKGEMFFNERDSIEYNRSSILSATPP
tara:strand:+ start:998 stop:1834 length:837 start_codon:yes stop_codon:yes gene_type:complete